MEPPWSCFLMTYRKAWMVRMQLSFSCYSSWQLLILLITAVFWTTCKGWEWGTLFYEVSTAFQIDRSSQSYNERLSLWEALYGMSQSKVLSATVFDVYMTFPRRPFGNSNWYKTQWPIYYIKLILDFIGGFKTWLYIWRALSRALLQTVHTVHNKQLSTPTDAAELPKKDHCKSAWKGRYRVRSRSWWEKGMTFKRYEKI